MKTLANNKPKIQIGDQLEYYDSKKQKWTYLYTMDDQDRINRTQFKLTQRWRQYRNYLRVIAESEADNDKKE